LNETLSRKYILILSAVSAVVLAGGAALRPAKPAPEQPSPSERANLQRMVRREELKEMASLFAERASALATSVVYLGDRKVSGVLWGATGQALTTGSGESDALLAAVPLLSTETPPSIVAAESIGGRWLLIAGRSSDHKLVWTVSMDGGSRGAECEGTPYRELVVNTPLSDDLAGAGVFDLDGALAGIVMRCGAAHHVAAAAGIPGLLKSLEAFDKRLQSRYGVRVTPLDEKASQLFEVANGLLLVELRNGGPAARMGLMAGDVILAADDQTVSSLADLWGALERVGTGAPVTLTAIRGGRKTPIVLNPPQTTLPTHSSDMLGIGFQSLSRLLPPVSIEPDSPAYKAGLRSGDRILQMGGRPEPPVAEMRRMMAAADKKPVLIIYERDAYQGAVVVAK
jgi:hypothetical protein